MKRTPAHCVAYVFLQVYDTCASIICLSMYINIDLAQLYSHAHARYFYAEKTLNSHLQGRLHQLNLDRSQSAERSVYVRGFPKTSSKAELIEFFVKFGPVHDVWMSGDGVS